MIKVKVSKKKAIYIGVAVILVVSLGFNVYQYLHNKDLNKKSADLQQTVNDLSVPVDQYGQQVEYKVVSQETKKVRVIDDVQLSKNSLSEGGELPYKDQEVKVIKVKITNKSESVYNFDGYSISAQTKEGVLISPVNGSLDPEDIEGLAQFGLVPGGSSEAVIYISTDSPEIVGLYDTNNSVAIKFE